MPKQLLNLRYVTAEEADEVIGLLEQAGFEHYVTPPGSFGISAGGIWLTHVEDYPRARELFDEYQAQRSKRIQEELDLERQEGRADTFWATLKRRPVQTGAYVAAAIFILMVLFAPVIQLGSAG